MSSWGPYPSICNVGHKAVSELLTAPVNVEEKVDGSQFSFGIFEDVGLCVRSKSAVVHLDAPEKLFDVACREVEQLIGVLHVGWTYRGEYLQRPRHNHLAYERVPRHHIILFDIAREEEDYLSYDEKVQEATRIGLECVPLIWQGQGITLEMFRGWLTRVSVLGGPTIEGVVIKPAGYDRFGRDHKVLMAKYVSEVYREEQKKTWRAGNPTSADIVTRLGDRYRTEARWRKALQHLRERGEITDSPRDIGLLLREVPPDIERECRDDIAAALFAHFWPQIRRLCTAGLPEWYKEHLLQEAFKVDDGESVTPGNAL
jgi:hypothetical protein